MSEESALFLKPGSRTISHKAVDSIMHEVIADDEVHKSLRARGTFEMLRWGFLSETLKASEKILDISANIFNGISHHHRESRKVITTRMTHLAEAYCRGSQPKSSCVRAKNTLFGSAVPLARTLSQTCPNSLSRAKKMFVLLLFEFRDDLHWDS